MSDGIRVTGIAPGLIQTEFSSVLWKDNKEVKPEAIGQSEDIGAVVATICSKDGKFMNAEVYQVHGGFPNL
jgi:NAD(P)-dependent dehydrogenase (short-subunit alcohol dehydrogenase family)